MLTTLRGMVADVGQTGVINATEVPTINAALPNPNSLEQMTFGTFYDRIDQWMRVLQNDSRASLEAVGVDEPGIARVMGWLEGRLLPQRGRRLHAAPVAGTHRPVTA